VTNEVRVSRDGFPHTGHPSGWYQVAWADEIGPGDVKPLHYFGRDLVIYRGESGDHHVMDAFCPHMGAHLGFGGCVAGEDIVCPYHGWTWAPDGHNVIVPSEGRPTDRRRIGTWSVQVANQIVWVWFDETSAEPWWPAPVDLPGVADGRRHDVYPHCARSWPNVRMHPQFVPENNVDIDHLHWIHRAEGPIDLLSYGPDGYTFRTVSRIIYGYGKPSTRLTPDGPIPVDVSAEIWGLGFQYTFFPEPDQSVSIQAQTPVDDDHCDMFQTVIVYTEPGVEPADEPTGKTAARVREQLVQIERDLPIWEHMRYLPNAALTRQEAKPMVALRKWAAQFYPRELSADADRDSAAAAR
jgi:phenylpropionate dioxygenase-like ring-hydroxylating dioxygenase large terminal subunit